MTIRWDEVTERIRALSRVSTPEELREFAAHVGVSEIVLQGSLEGRSRLSAIKVITAFVRRGVDAKWMLTGDVDPALHRRMLEGEPDEIEGLVKTLIADISRTSGDGVTGLQALE